MFRVLWGRNTDRTAWMPLPGEHSLLPRILLSCSHSAVRIRGTLTSAQNTTVLLTFGSSDQGNTSAQNTTVLLTFGSSDQGNTNFCPEYYCPAHIRQFG